jgi:hypothetical protein
MPFKTVLENMPQPSLLDASAINNYYNSVGIQSLSPSQIRRLKKGHNVRVKLGTAHNIHLSPEQIKKLHAAAKKGKAITVVFDPIQIQNHGSGVFGNISGKSKAKGKGVVSDIFHTAGNVSKTVGLGVARKHTPAAKKRGTKKGKGFFGDLGNIAKTGALSIAQQGIDAGANYLNNKVNAMGGALKRHRIVGRKVAHKKKSFGGSGSGGALYPAGVVP